MILRDQNFYAFIYLVDEKYKFRQVLSPLWSALKVVTNSVIYWQDAPQIFVLSTI